MSASNTDNPPVVAPSWQGERREGSAANETRAAAGMAHTMSETLYADGYELHLPPVAPANGAIPRQTVDVTRDAVASNEFSSSTDNQAGETQARTQTHITESNSSASSSRDHMRTETRQGQSNPQWFLDSTLGAAGSMVVAKEPTSRERHEHHAMIPPDHASSHRRYSTTSRPPLTHPNGALIFPDLSAEQQESESTEATTQAENSIIADSDEVASLFDATEPSDAGYESDVITNASTSISSSVRDFMYENGRRYHRFREGQYNFPNDELEQEREDMKHAMVKLLCSQKLNFAPIGDNPHEILDMGTGTGIWAIEMGDQYPSATVLGVDLSPIQPDWVPPNVKFEVDDVESQWLYKTNHFDYIHSRHTVMAIKDWRSLFQRAMEHLKPGGWIELQEIHHFPASANGSMAATHPVARYWRHVGEGLANLGVDLNAAGGDKLPGMMREAGFTDVTERVFHVPIGTWPRNRVLKTVGMYWRTVLLDGLQAIALGPFTRGLGWSVERTELFLVDVRRGYRDNAALMYMPLRVMYAQKPRGA